MYAWLEVERGKGKLGARDRKKERGHTKAVKAETHKLYVQHFALAENKVTLTHSSSTLLSLSCPRPESRRPGFLRHAVQ